MAAEPMIAIPQSVFAELLAAQTASAAVLSKLAQCQQAPQPRLVPRLLTVKQLMERIGKDAISEARLREAARQNKIPHINIGTRVRFPEDRVATWIAEGCPL